MTRLLPLTALLALIGCGTTGDTGKTGETGTTVTNGCDEDGDGFCASDGDCDETDALINPGAQEICDGADNNCDGGVDEGLVSSWYQDSDGDGYGDDNSQMASCDPGVGWVQQGGDCDDGAPSINPGVDEICDTIDNNCDGRVDEDLTGTFYEDTDNDSYGDPGTEFEGCDPGAGWVGNGDDCDDRDQFINPGAEEVCNEIDDDCDSYIDEDVAEMYFRDLDGDSYGDRSAMEMACPGTPGLVSNDDDCDDADYAVNPAATEVCDGVDNDCDLAVDEGVTSVYYDDRDGDSYGDPSTMTSSCTSPGSSWVTNANDCNDSEPLAWTGAMEVCDSVDNDCDGGVDEGVSNTYYRDGDSDSYGDPATSVTACSDPGDVWVTNSNDCNDTEPLAWTGATEVCDSVDNDCDGRTDEGVTSTWYADSDGDTYGDPSSAVDSCASPGSGYTSNNGDCNDSEPRAWTGALEYCDSVDNDCDGRTDEDPVDGGTFPSDDDGDGFGDPLSTTTACSGVDNTLDCDDSLASEPQVVDGSSTAASPDGSAASPWLTVQEGIDNAMACVVVNAGTYNESIDFNGSDISVTSVEGPLTTVLFSSSGSVVTFMNGETSAAVLSGFTIAGGNGTMEDSVESGECGSSASCAVTTHTYYGGGIYVDGAAPTIEDNIVRTNVLPGYLYQIIDATHEEYTYSYGGGIAVMNSTGTLITGSDVSLNSADVGGGIAVGSSSAVTIKQSLVSYNTAVSNGGGLAVLDGTATVSNTIFADDQAGSYGGGIYLADGSGTFTNITVVGGDATSGGGIADMGSSTVTMMNSIVAWSSSGDGFYLDASASASLMYNDVYGNTSSDYTGMSAPSTGGNISSDPLFMSWTDNTTDDDDLTLGAGSPAMNAGNPASAYNDADGTRNDMGAYGGAGGSF